MNKKLLMAIDLGTSFIKVGVYNLTGDCIAVSMEAVQDERLSPGVFIQRGDQLFTSVLSCVKSVVEKVQNLSKYIEAISFTGQMAGFIGVDKNWKDITGWSCSLDTRYASFAEKQMELLRNEFSGISGTNGPLFSAKIEWFENAYPSESVHIAKYMMVNGYIIGRLSDSKVEEAVIDNSLLTWTGLADVRQKIWSDTICDKLKISKSKLPRIVASTEVVAYLSEKIAKAIGLKSGIPLICGAGDKIAGCVGANVLKKGDILYEAASFGALSCVVNDFRPDQVTFGYDILNGCEKDTLYAHYYMPGSGITMDWYRKLMGTSFSEMDAKIITLSPGSDGLFAVGMLGGTAMPFDAALRGVWLGHTWSHKKEHFYRSLCESFGFSLATALDCIRKNYPECDSKQIKMIGGGAVNENGNQLLSDILGLETTTINRNDTALWGASIIAAKGVDLIEDIKLFSEQHVHTDKSYVPNEENHKKYQKLREQYNQYIKEFSIYCKKRIQ